MRAGYTNVAVLQDVMSSKSSWVFLSQQPAVPTLICLQVSREYPLTRWRIEFGLEPLGTDAGDQREMTSRRKQVLVWLGEAFSWTIFGTSS